MSDQTSTANAADMAVGTHLETDPQSWLTLYHELVVCGRLPVCLRARH
jgi:hypothetical protein